MINTKEEFIKINVGGELFTTRKETLLSSVYLRALFSGKYNDDLSTLIIDRDPKIFRHVLNLLRDASYNYPLKYLTELDFYGIDYETDEDISPLQPEEENKLEMDVTHSDLYKCPTDPMLQLLYRDPQADSYTKENMVIKVDKNTCFLRIFDYITKILIVAKADKRTLNKIHMDFGYMKRISFDPPVCQLLSRIGKPKDLQSFEKYLEDKKFHVYEIPVDIKTVSIVFSSMTMKTEYDVDPLEEHVYVYGGLMPNEERYAIYTKDIADVGMIFCSHYYPINETMQYVMWYLFHERSRRRKYIVRWPNYYIY
jgi:BTB/POZ domain